MTEAHTAEKDAGLTTRCSYVTAANMQCLLAVNEPHTYGHDTLGDRRDDPEWGRKRAWAWEQMRQANAAYERGFADGLSARVIPPGSAHAE